MSNTMALLRVERLSKTYRDGTRALREVDLAVAPGELITVVGPSGCGKSTLLRLIAGLDTPSSGRVWYQGKDITTLPAEQRGMGVVFQNYALFPHMSVADNIGFGLRVRGVALHQRRRKVAELLERLQLGQLAQRRPHQLSGGQQQRVALGRALAIEPSLLLLDEPLTALDAQLREQLRSELRHTLAQFQTTSIYVTHDQAEALSLGDRVVVMHGGQVVQVGTPRDIYQQPASAVVAQFIGVSNRLKGVIAFTQQGIVVRVPQLDAALDEMVVAAPAHPVAALGEGSCVELLIRPEDLRLCTPEQAHYTGVLAQLQFLGDRLRLFVQYGNGTDELIADVDPHTQLRSGDRIALRVQRAFAWRADDAHTRIAEMESTEKV
jgi:putative spermidine/putrescine transport system ATP-binding protein